jgi:hypothetical protein
MKRHTFIASYLVSTNQGGYGIFNSIYNTGRIKKDNTSVTIGITVNYYLNLYDLYSITVKYINFVP